MDDSLTMRQLVKLVLESVDFEVIEAEDGRDGLDKLGVHADTAMMISDVWMPRLDGIEMVEAVKRSPRHVRLPILILSAETQAELIERAKKAGVAGWMVKPLDPERLLTVVKRLTGT